MRSPTSTRNRCVKRCERPMKVVLGVLFLLQFCGGIRFLNPLHHIRSLAHLHCWQVLVPLMAQAWGFVRIEHPRDKLSEGEPNMPPYWTLVTSQISDALGGTRTKGTKKPKTTPCERGFAAA